MKWLEKFFLPKNIKNEFTFKRYIRDLETKVFRDIFNLGVSENNNWLTARFLLSPNAVYLGAMGSGKSVAANFTTLTWMLANSDQTILFIVDTVKGANDYQALFEYDQVHPILSSEVAVHRVIDLLYDEAMARREAFNAVQAENLEEYEKKTKKKIARCILLIEEFHALPYAVLNFDKDYKIENTSAFKFHQIMRIGRSMGTWVIACSQKGTKSDIPSEIIPNFTNKQIFRVSKAEAAYFLGDTKASEIRTDQKGRAETDYGAVQFPYISLPTQKKLLKKYMEPLAAECCYLTPDLIKDYINGRSTEELYKLKKLSDLVEGIETFDHELVVAMIHKNLGHKVRRIDSKIDPFGISMVVEWPNKGDIAVMIRVGSKKITGKHLHKLRKAMEHMNCPRGILYTSAEDLPQAIYKSASNENIEVVDHEDMLRLAHQIEAKVAALKDLDPSRLADDSKESGEYQRNHPRTEEDEEIDPSVYEIKDETPPSAKPAVPSVSPQIRPTYIEEVVDDTKPLNNDAHERLQKIFEKTPPAEKPPGLTVEAPPEVKAPPAIVTPAPGTEEEVEESEPEELTPEVEAPEASIDDIESNTNPNDIDKNIEASMVASIRSSVKPIKRVPVRGTYWLKSDDSPEVLIHLQKNTQGDVYRALIYVIVHKKVIHKYFLDRQVTGDFDIKDRARLSVVDTNDWNKQNDEVNRRPVYDTATFEKELLLYLDNLKQIEFGRVKTICWQEDIDFLTPILSKCRHIDPHPTVLEEMASVYGLNNNREELTAANSKSVKKIDIFRPIEIDLNIWATLSP